MFIFIYLVRNRCVNFKAAFEIIKFLEFFVL